jgi:hypothetical protein
LTSALADANPRLNAALEYAARGWPVVPLHTPLPDGSCDCRKATCDAVGKHPRTRDGLKSATTDAAKIRKWWSMWPHANVGVRTGELRPGWYLSVLDVDPRAAGDESLENLEAKHGKLPETKLALTGGGGRHFVFEGDKPLKTTSGRLSSGLDTRGGGGSFGAGYIVAPPSKHHSGREYTWELSSPDTPAVPPSWLLAMVNGPTVVGGTAPMNDGDRIVDGQAGGTGRKKSLHSMGRTMRARGMTEEEILAALLVVNEHRCDPPLDEKDVRRVAEHAARVAPGRSPEYEAKANAKREREREPGEDDDQPQPRWWEGHGLVYDKHGNLKNTFANLCTVLRFAPTYSGQFSYNEMILQPVREGKTMSDGDIGHLREQIEKLYGFSPETGNLHQSLITVAEERRFHPVRQYLDGLQWDGVSRLGRVAQAILGVTDQPLACSMIRKWFIAAVARAMNPGCKVDSALILTGDQKLFKSTFFQVLGGKWHSCTRIDPTNKDSLQQINAAWVFELAEIDSVTSRSHASDLKQFMTCSTDAFRPPYGRSVQSVPRSGVMCGTTNKIRFLTDETGSRRFWIVTVLKKVDIRTLALIRDQLWAEAAEIYRRHKTDEHLFWLTDEEEAVRECDAEQYADEDPWRSIITSYFQDLFRRGNLRNDYRIIELARDPIKISVSDNLRIAKPFEQRLGAILTSLGLKRRYITIVRDKVRFPQAWTWEFPSEAIERLKTETTDP